MMLKTKKRMRILSSKRPKTPTEYHSRGFGTQWAVRVFRTNLNRNRLISMCLPVYKLIE